MLCGSVGGCLGCLGFGLGRDLGRFGGLGGLVGLWFVVVGGGGFWWWVFCLVCSSSCR